MKHVKISSQARVASWSLAAFAAGIVYGFLVAPKVYQAPPFATLVAVMPVGAWAVCWAVVAAVMLIAAVTRSGVAWMIGVIVAIALATCWLIGLMFQWVVNRTPLSASGVALWCWFVVTLLMFVRSPRQFEQIGPG